MNLDASVKQIFSPSLTVGGVPSLTKLAREAALKAQITGTETTLSDIWSQNVSAPSGGSDHVEFISRFGIPVLVSDIQSTNDAYQFETTLLFFFKDLFNVKFFFSFSAVYHSNYDSFNWVQNFGDSNFSYHAALAQFHGYMILRLADDSVLPFDHTDYAYSMFSQISSYQTKYGNLSIDWNPLLNAIQLFNQSAVSVNTEAQSYLLWENGKDPSQATEKALQLRDINDRLMKVDRTLLSNDPLLTASSFYNHVIYSFSSDDSYESDLWPGLVAQLVQGNASQAQFVLGRLALIVEAAAYSLSDSLL